MPRSRGLGKERKGSSSEAEREKSLPTPKHDTKTQRKQKRKDRPTRQSSWNKGSMPVLQLEPLQPQLQPQCLRWRPLRGQNSLVLGQLSEKEKTRRNEVKAFSRGVFWRASSMTLFLFAPMGNMFSAGRLIDRVSKMPLLFAPCPRLALPLPSNPPIPSSLSWPSPEAVGM